MKKLYAYFLLFISLIVYSQGVPLNIKSPETYSFEKRGNIPINKFSGGLDLNIPLFDLNVGDLSSQINLSYDSSGFLPAKKSGFAGLNWSINYAGVISREVKEIPDDFIVNDSNSLQGFLSTVNFGKTNQDIFNNNYQASALEYNATSTYGIYINDGKYAELSSDKYNFNFWGITGYFYIGNDGTPLVSSNDPNLTVDLSGYSQQNATEQIDCNPQNSQMIITDGRGNRYYFGGSFNNLEISSSLGREANPQNPGGLQLPNFTILSWYLTKVELISGQRVVYNYNEDRLGYGSEYNYCQQTNTLPYPASMNDVAFSFETHKYVSQQVSNNKYQLDTSIGGSHVTGSGVSSVWTAPFWMYNVLKKTKLVNISVATKNPNNNEYKITCSVDFEYQNAIDNNYRYDFLKSIEVNNPGQLIKKFDFKIEPKGAVAKRWFLTELNINDQKYKFNYNKDDFFPPAETFGVDFWGYWNGKDNTSSIIPSYSFNRTTGDLVITGDNRSFNEATAEVGMLKEIIYPTGGSTELFFEPHQIGSKIVKNSQSNFYPQQISVNNEITSGFRIFKMIDQPISGPEIITEYKYLKNRNNSSLGSSGIARGNYTFFKYAKFRTKLPVGFEDKEIMTESGNNLEQDIFSRGNVEYSKVQEYVNQNLFKEYVFSNYGSYPDRLDDDYMSNNIVLWRTSSSNLTPLEYMKNSNVQYIDESDKRGKLIEEISFKNHNEIRRITNEYGILNNKLYCKNFKVNNIPLTYKCVNTINDYYTDVKLIGGHWKQKMRIRVRPFVKVYSALEEYLPNGNIYTNTLYNYDDNTTLNLSSINTSSSNNEEIIKNSYKYPSTNYVSKLINKNILSPTIETSISKDIWKSITYENYVTSHTKTEYNSADNIFPSAHLSYDINTGIPEKQISYDQYDVNGNLLQYTTKSGVPTAIIWGYNQTQPIAKIHGVTHAEVSELAAAIVTASDYGSLSYSEDTLKTQLDNFRMSLPNYQISTYTYKPLVGVTSITPPSGIREVYKYDSANRMQSVVDINGNILKEYSYNYAPTIHYNSEESQPFTRNNCGSSAIGGIYTYYVPKGKYSSYFNQADADQMAQNDISNNGQNAANINGSCTPFYCPVSFYFSGGANVTVQSNNYYKLNLSFGTGANSTNLPWTTGVLVATIQGTCRPSSEYNSYNGQIYYTIKTNGDIILRSHTGGPLPNNTTFNYPLVFPVN